VLVHSSISLVREDSQSLRKKDTAATCPFVIQAIHQIIKKRGNEIFSILFLIPKNYFNEILG